MSGKHDRHAQSMRPLGGTVATDNHATGGFQQDVPGFRRSTLRQGITRMDGLVRAGRSENKNPGSLSGRRQRTSGSRRPDGNPFGNAGGGADNEGPRFDLNVPPNGYGWWYADAISDDGQFGFSIIAMIGSVFSPYYAWSGRSNPQNHVALNVGLYGKRVKRWTMTERGINDLEQEADFLRFGPSTLIWDGDTLVIEIDEWANPIFRKVKGRIEITPDIFNRSSYQLDGNGRHFWQPIAPKARTKVEFEKPGLNWSGDAYIDSNWGSEPLEAGFINWDWSRAHLNDGTGILYDAFTRDGENRQLVLKINADSTIEELAPSPRVPLKKGPIWRVPRSTLSTDKNSPRTLQMLEDTPFYTRSHIETTFDGESVIAVHESLDCNRFASQWVRCLLPFRMPRIAG